MRPIFKALIFNAALITTSIYANEYNTQCASDKYSQHLVDLIISDHEQQRTKLRCDKRLVTAAIEKVAEMAETEFVFHGRANGRLRDQGVELPIYYGIGNANQVEALAGGQKSPEVVWKSFKESTSHADHLLARNAFYRKQTLIGAAHIYLPSTSHGHYWVVYITEEDNASEKNIFHGPIPNKTSHGVFYQSQNEKKPIN
ncbi:MULTISPECIES: hypothetical protein [unclassified Pseudoalteromonas]|uniref:hypothetical protein n=1 Tax=unclassified Pseudoalteromonas TaxID=194690 RepID=UPI0006D64548|nr:MULTISPECIES: hypothetical protein [unclassified Pseudoalteromonas]KPV97616.1 hypothetical protein AN214_00581 [Pseudoalteromonas sp. P1-9]MCF6457898.1 CAP domain-containing protein [Pseudoalteromonas sp. MMG024]